MNDNPMTEQVARLVGNLLAGGRAIFLPGIGSLQVERQAARRIDRRHVVPPCRSVQFSSQERGVSLVDEIARVLKVNGVPPEDPVSEAQKVYDRWMAQVRDGETLTISGIGVLRFKDFKLDPEFDRRLNPQGHEPVRVRAPRRFDAVLWIGIVAIVCVLGATAWWWFGLKQSGDAAMVARVAERASASRQIVAECTSGDAASTAAAATDSIADSAVVSSEPEATSGPGEVRTPSAATPEAVREPAERVAGSESGPVREPAERAEGSGTGPVRMTSGRHYVVMGVFSSAQNAERAARDAASKDVAMTCGIYRFGAKFMVSPFESEDPEACKLFIRAHAERFPGMWTYTAR